MERPDILDSTVQRIETGHDRIYVHINTDEDGRPIEVFINGGNSGSTKNGWLEALGKTISNALRSGTDPEIIANDLRHIRSPKVAWDNEERVESIPDAVGIAIQRFLQGKTGQPLNGDPDAEDEPREVTAEEAMRPNLTEEVCQSCGSTDVHYEDGVLICDPCELA